MFARRWAQSWPRQRSWLRSPPHRLPLLRSAIRKVALSAPARNAAKRAEYRRRRHWQLAQPHPDRVIDSVGDCGRGRDIRRLGNAVGVGCALALIVFQQKNLDVRRLAGACNLVMLEIGIEHMASMTIDDAILEQGVGEAHQHAALDLTFDEQRIHGASAILDRK